MGKFTSIAFAGITAGLVALFSTLTPGAQAAPDSARSSLPVGNYGDAASFWASFPVGKPGHLKDDDSTRRAVCNFASRHGGVRAEAVELSTDVMYDNFRNYKQLTGWVADLAQGDCLRLGYSDLVSGMAPVNLRTELPKVKGKCWVEVYYLGKGKNKIINKEPICAG